MNWWVPVHWPIKGPSPLMHMSKIPILKDTHILHFFVFLCICFAFVLVSFWLSCMSLESFCFSLLWFCTSLWSFCISWLFCLFVVFLYPLLATWCLFVVDFCLFGHFMSLWLFLHLKYCICGCIAPVCGHFASLCGPFVFLPFILLMTNPYQNYECFCF